MKIAVFIDYWNFQLTLNERVSSRDGTPSERVQIDWRSLGQILSFEACAVLGVDPAIHSYEGTYIYTSFNPRKESDKKFRHWVTTWLDRQPGINVEIRERKPKALPRCPRCHREITHCPNPTCQEPIVATIEKGVDTFLVTDLLRYGMQGTYDAAVLASSDGDMVPGVQFIQTQGKKVIQAGFPPSGIELATECWGSFDVMKIVGKIRRA